MVGLSFFKVTQKLTDKYHVQRFTLYYKKTQTSQGASGLKNRSKWMRLSPEMHFQPPSADLDPLSPPPTSTTYILPLRTGFRAPSNLTLTSASTLRHFS